MGGEGKIQGLWEEGEERVGKNKTAYLGTGGRMGGQNNGSEIIIMGRASIFCIHHFLIMSLTSFSFFISPFPCRFFIWQQILFDSLP